VLPALPHNSGYTPDAGFLEFVKAGATRWDQDGALPDAVVARAGRAGLLAADLPAKYGGAGLTPLQMGELCAQVGGVCTAVRGLLTVQGMVAAALDRWGDTAQRDRWLPPLAAGIEVAGFAATEAEAGTELAAVRTSIERQGDQVVVRGRKLWVTFGQQAGFFLVLGLLDGQPATVLVESGRTGVEVEPVRGQLGLRAAGVAHLRFDGVRVPRRNLVAAPGFGLSHVVGTALDHGRFTVAWGCAGLAAACLDLSARHVAGRDQNGVRLAEHQSVRAMLGRAYADTTAARELCGRAARLRQARDPAAIGETVLAKYSAARAAAAVSRDAVQLHGAAGCEADSVVGRFFRDAKVMQIIEGADEVAEVRLGDYALRRVGAFSGRQRTGRS